jgi:hypothetical protein
MGHSLPDLEFRGGYRVIQFSRGLALSVFTSHRNLAHPARPSHGASGLRAGSWARPLLRSQPAGLLWLLVHRGTWGTPRHILAIGAFSALVAAGFQGMTGGPAPRKVSVAGEPEASRLCHRVATGADLSSVQARRRSSEPQVVTTQLVDGPAAHQRITPRWNATGGPW